MKKQIIVDENNYYKRLDKLLRFNFPKIKLGSIFKSIRKGHVYVNGKKIKKNDFNISIGDSVEIEIIDDKNMIRPLKPSMKARPLDFEIIYENDDFLVINKPSKVSMHPGQGEQMVTIIEGVKYHANDSYDPHLVHRLDKLTSGVLIIAKNKNTSRLLSEIIQSRKAKKYYLTLLKGTLKNKSGELKSLVDSKEAHSEYSVLKEYETNLGFFSLVKVLIHTGRKHQIRVQFSEIGNPVLGDDHYGDRALNREVKNNYGLRRFFLHAYNLKFNFKNKDYDLTAELDKDLKKVLSRIEENSIK
ncbi:RluA family pseudouridine synthase [Oceanotoga sp. DSM 15011]|jgi:23S rRNA pseudouridine955/2504/2580 synthase|uniref:Ribosomal large subunit pseudouridine synthase C n=1 Tax=Oceanotoga teriensis TaxID=515440 RepID=A0AA45C8M0_9BACT|nr:MULTISPECIES: RluA family pseudouridine synthase [Oceanotoga]MDN5342477.1 rRNA pseudouridine synthase [Oceanotoga sp.]MDO7975570.1 RluA family pseudouridine synthase [Oceanotoga teriensis]PWJ96141.1 ribosomal large subunit pseudouridine synthase C [Oceanotoga teriensis]UYO99924.1 RluA family pseudouridine synthase [Oceanotoga sp. DSM 15011]